MRNEQKICIFAYLTKNMHFCVRKIMKVCEWKIEWKRVQRLVTQRIIIYFVFERLKNLEEQIDLIF